MAVNPYDLCPCGSGKKFKWCCTPFFDKVQRAFELADQGQHEASIKAMDQVAQDNASNPAVWGYYANLLFMEEQPEKAEEILDRAFAVQPNYPMGHLLKGIMRHREGEILGALMLFRKAAEAFSLEAHDQLAQVHELIAQNEDRLGHPVAARAALERALRFSPSDSEIRQVFEGRFGPLSALPEAARKAYSLRPTAKKVDLEGAMSGRLSDAKTTYERVTQLVPEDPAGWFNLGLVQAWLGQQLPAFESLNKSLELEWDDALVEETGALIEVIRMGTGLEAETDYLDEVAIIQLRDGRPLGQLLQSWDAERRMAGVEADPEGRYFNAMLIEEIPNLLETGTTMARVVCTMSIMGGAIRLWNQSSENVRKIATEIRDRLNLAVGEPTFLTRTSGFQDVSQPGLIVPISTANIDEVKKKLLDHMSNYLENIWIHKPMKSLSGTKPLDAGGSKLLRKRLLGVLRFVQGCFEQYLPKQRDEDGETVRPVIEYDWNRLRHKLNANLEPAGPAPTFHVPEDPKPEPPPVVVPPTPEPTPVVEEAPAQPVKRDFTVMNAADLAALPAESLNAIELEDALRSALRQDARELAVKFAKLGVVQPPEPTRTDRYPFYACLITAAVSESDLPGALARADAGNEYDQTHNNGKRVNEFGLRKAQLLSRKGDFDAAVLEFERILNRNPDEPKFYINAIEAMLSAKQGARALSFAEKAIAKARALNNRDFEGACQELSEAAKKQMK